MRHREVIVVASLVAGGVFAPIAVQTASADDAAPGEAEWRALRDTGTPAQLRGYLWEAPYGSRYRAEAVKRLQALEPPRAAAWPPNPVQAVWVPPSDPPPPSGLVEPLPPSNEPANPPSGPWDWNAPQPDQRAVLFEEDPADPGGKQFAGTAVWRIEPAPSAFGLDTGVAVRVDVDIPERGMAVRLTLRRNADKTLPASHIVEITFRLSPDFAHGGVANVPGVMMRETTRRHGDPLDGVAIKVTDNVFIVGLSSAKVDVPRHAIRDAAQHNAGLLKAQGWLDIPAVYADGKRALIAIDKGEAGARAFAEAFATWERDRR
jgi:hypothetical protein